MIKITQRITASAVWDIEGTEVRLPYRKEYPESVMRKKIEDYRSALESRLMSRTILGFVKRSLSLEGLLSLQSDYPAEKYFCDAFLITQCSLHRSG